MVVKMRSREAFIPQNVYLICTVHGPPKFKNFEFSETQILVEIGCLQKKLAFYTHSTANSPTSRDFEKKS